MVKEIHLVRIHIEKQLNNSMQQKDFCYEWPLIYTITPTQQELNFLSVTTRKVAYCFNCLFVLFVLKYSILSVSLTEEPLQMI